MARAFLTAEWRQLAMINYAVDRELLLPLVPAGTELDSWKELTFVSLVGFLFKDTRVLGVPVPFCRTFEEVNLRFYVRRDVGGEHRRGVTFVRELVPRSAIALVARLTYNEPYLALPMRHSFGPTQKNDAPSWVEYGWRAQSGWSSIRVKPRGAGRRVATGSEQEFITEHYWGYTRQRDGSTVEYEVTHPSWRVWDVDAPTVSGDLGAIYGPAFAEALKRPPESAFLADGSAVTVWNPTRLGAIQHKNTRAKS